MLLNEHRAVARVRVTNVQKNGSEMGLSNSLSWKLEIRNIAAEKTVHSCNIHKF